MRNLKNLSILLVMLLSFFLILSGCGDDGATVFTAPQGDTGATGATGVTGPVDLATLQVNIDLPADVPSEDVIVAVARTADQIVTSSQVIEGSALTYVFTELLPGTYTGTVAYNGEVIANLRGITVVGGETNLYPKTGSINIGNAYILYEPSLSKTTELPSPTAAPTAEPTAEPASEPEYNLGKLSLLTGGITDVGTFAGPVKVIAFSPEGVLYGIRYVDTKPVIENAQLVTIDRETLTLTDVGTVMTGIDYSYVSGLNFDTEGNLWLSLNDTNFYQVDTATGQATLIGSNSMIVDDVAAFDEVFGFGYGKASIHYVFKISTTDASVSDDFATILYDGYIDFDSFGTLWAISTSTVSLPSSSTMNIYTIDTGDSSVSEGATGEEINFYDLAIY